ncbi:MAG: radical SAM protein [Candidatus Omnitrophota bacterium]|nr:MAG: radical SAM protein [Candidatus Omnitrophota bacterium]
MKIVISYPPLQGPGSPMLTQNRQFQWYNEPSYIYPVVSGVAATLLKNEGFEVIWNDCIVERWTQEQFFSFIKKERPDIIAFETKTPVIKQHWQIINKLTTYNLQHKTILYGDHVTALPEESMKNCNVDFVITGGDYDISLLSIAKHIRDGAPLAGGIRYREDGEIKNTGEFKLHRNLDKLPFPDRDLTKAYLYGEKWKRYKPFFYTMAGRDCWWNRCSFCSWPQMYPKFRLRSVNNLLDEIGMLIEKYGAKEIFDDTGTFPVGDWLKQFCEGMIERGYNKRILFSCNMNYQGLVENIIRLMKKANFRKLKMGLESANQKTLDMINKNVAVDEIIKNSKMIKKGGIDIHLTIMVGYPWESKAEAENTLNVAMKLMTEGYVEMLQATVLVPYPGTALYKQAQENDWFRIDSRDYDRFDMSEPVLKTNDMSPDEVMQMCRRTYEIFLQPKFIIRNLAKIRSANDINYILRGAKAVLGHIRDFSR